VIAKLQDVAAGTANGTLCHISGNRKMTPDMPKVIGVVASEAAGCHPAGGADPPPGA
jgi:hypothetical protein